MIIVERLSIERSGVAILLLVSLVQIQLNVTFRSHLLSDTDRRGETTVLETEQVVTHQLADRGCRISGIIGRVE